MNKRIVYENDEGGVSVIVPAPEFEMFWEEVFAKRPNNVPNVPEGKEYLIVDTSEIPPDRTFRNAWEYSKDGIVISFPKAQELTKKRLRIERAPLLQEQDILFQRALETGADTTAIVAEKQRLRDITELVDNCVRLEQLKTLTVEMVVEVSI